METYTLTESQRNELISSLESRYPPTNWLRELKPNKKETVRVWCDTCEGSGIVHEESQIGVPGSGGDITCPDCEGNGYNSSLYFKLA